jgi:hypothetical protein
MNFELFRTIRFYFLLLRGVRHSEHDPFDIEQHNRFLSLI